MGMCCCITGGTFALFSLLKRQAGLGVRGKAMASDRLLKQYSTGLAASPSTTLGWATCSMRRRPTRPAGAPAAACSNQAACLGRQMVVASLPVHSCAHDTGHLHQLRAVQQGLLHTFIKG